MALSNIFREPRREITESVVGIIAVAGIAYADYAYARWLAEDAPADKYSEYVVIGMALGLFVLFGVVIFSAVTHAAGEAICNALEKRGFYLRPRQRY